MKTKNCTDRVGFKKNKPLNCNRFITTLYIYIDVHLQSLRSIPAYIPHCSLHLGYTTLLILITHELGSVCRFVFYLPSLLNTLGFSYNSFKFMRGPGGEALGIGPLWPPTVSRSRVGMILMYKLDGDLAGHPCRCS